LEYKGKVPEKNRDVGMDLETPRQVVKRDGRIVPFDEARILAAIKKAMMATRGQAYLREEEQRPGGGAPNSILETALKALLEKYGREGKPHVEEIQNVVEQSLMQGDLYDVAKAYVLYRRERQKEREEKMRLLSKDSVDEVDKLLSLNAVRLLASRYLIRDERGRIIETPKQMFQRTAALIVISDILHDPQVFDKSGREKRWDLPNIEPAALGEKFGLGFNRDERSFKVAWNKFHIQRMYELYKELNEQGTMKLSWENFVSKLASRDFEDYYSAYRRYYDMMIRKEFMPNSPTLFNAGARLGQLSACFVLPIEDSMESIMKSASDCALIFQSGGGVGINYSHLRPEGDIVASTGGIASGPVTFMRIVDTVTDVVKQGGKRRGANMGILNISHPDIEKFVKSKLEQGRFENFNISVLVEPDFWDSFQNRKPWPLKNPRDGSTWETKDPIQLFREIATEAWNTADPGVVYLDTMNADNPLRDYWGDIISTNPCGEEPMFPYESCNLGSINLYAFVKISNENEPRKASIDWERLAEAIRNSVRFLDNVIDVNKFPVQEIARVSKQTRRIGLGLMGLADTLYALGIPYNSEEGFSFMSKVAEFFAYHSIKESVKLAKERGAFALFEYSTYKRGQLPFEAFRTKKSWSMDWKSLAEDVQRDGIRNSHTMTIAPTGSISMIVDVSSGLEPQFALVFEKHVTVGSFYYVDPELERQLTETGEMREGILKRISENGGSLQGIDDIKRTHAEMEERFLVAYDIPWWDHVRAQYEMQKWISASVSKTINMPSWVGIDDVEKAYLFAYKLGLKGITIYRDGSKGNQVLRTPSQRQSRYVNPVTNRTLEMMREFGIEAPSKTSQIEFPMKGISESNTDNIAQQTTLFPPKDERQLLKCPSCGSFNIVSQEGCRKCLDCGWSTCTVA
jgi:ribonucleoside-diphosphate reductase alpha chain